MRPVRPIAALGALAASALIAAGCGSESSSAGGEEANRYSSGGTKPGKGGARLPKALAANRAQANVLLPGARAALEAKLAELEGHPVVVNQWASWCPPCRAEFPYFQAAAEAYSDSVAFLGIDMEDRRGPASEFLSDHPVPYPSIEDPDREAIISLGGGFASPTTVYIDASGEIVAVVQAPYTGQEQLDDDIERYLEPS